jgi:hypothetical protein
MIQKIKGILEMEALRGGNMLHNLLINMLINLLAPPRVSETGNTFYLKYTYSRSMFTSKIYDSKK